MKKSLPKNNLPKIKEYDEEVAEITTKSYIDKLKDLEEDPVGTPRPNLPENRVIVVTTPSTT